MKRSDYVTKDKLRDLVEWLEMHAPYIVLGFFLGILALVATWLR
ncbi:MAG: hypothetical protein ACYS7Y_34590 [Planctomycetota bacterium]